MKQNRLYDLIFMVLVLLLTVVTEIIVWLVLAFGLFFITGYIFPEVRTEGEGGLMILAIAIWATPVLLGLGLIPAYFISMKIAEWLRQKRGWPLRHPRRLFLLALAIPIIFLILSSAFPR